MIFLNYTIKGSSNLYHNMKNKNKSNDKINLNIVENKIEPLTNMAGEGIPIIFKKIKKASMSNIKKIL